MKSVILNKFKEKINHITSAEDLNEFRRTLPDDPAYKVLATAQGLTSRLFKLKTSSIAALEEMLNKRSEELDPQGHQVKNSY